MSRARLEVTDALGARSVRIDKEIFSIGRRSANDLHLTGGDISRDHASIELKDDRFTLKDSGSRCGTFVNGEPISERVLEHGDRIHMGRSSGADLVFLVDESTSLVTPAPQRLQPTFVRSRHSWNRSAPLGSGRVLDEVLALVLDSALEVTGAELRLLIMLAIAAGRLSGNSSWDAADPMDPSMVTPLPRVARFPKKVFTTGTSRARRLPTYSTPIKPAATSARSRSASDTIPYVCR